MKKTFLLFFVFIITFGAVMAQNQKTRPRINHIAFSVAELERSRIFYQEIIGLDTIPEPFHDGRHVWFSVSENAHLHLIQNPPPIEVPSKNTHLCFSVPDMKSFVAKLVKRKIHYEDWPGKPFRYHHPGRWYSPGLSPGSGWLLGRDQ
jgi:lactoylglutathione lyase